MSSSTGRPHYFLKQGPSLNSVWTGWPPSKALELPISAPRAGNTDTCSSPWLSWRCWWSNFKSSYFHNKHYIYLPSHPTPQHKLWSSGRIGSACNHWAISLYPVPYGEGERIAIQPSLQCECTWSNFHLSLRVEGGTWNPPSCLPPCSSYFAALQSRTEDESAMRGWRGKWGVEINRGVDR